MLAGSPHGPSAWGLGSEPQDPHPHGGCLQPVEKSKATACSSLPPPCPKGLGSPQVLLAAAPQLGCAPEDTVGWLSTHCVDTAPTSKELCEQGTVNPFVRVQQATYSLWKVAFLAWFTFFFFLPNSCQFCQFLYSRPSTRLVCATASGSQPSFQKPVFLQHKGTQQTSCRIGMNAGT